MYLLDVAKRICSGIREKAAIK